MDEKIYTTNAEGLAFTLKEYQDFMSGKGYHGQHGCYYCPANNGFEQGSGYICGPCGQQNCWVDTAEEDGND